MKIRFSIIAIACLFAGYFVSVSCGGGPTIDIPIDNISIELNDIMVSAPDKAPTKNVADDEDGDEFLNRFDAEHTVSVNDLAGITDELMDYLSQIQSADVSTATIVITDESGEGTVVENFVLGAKGFINSVNIPQYYLNVPIAYEPVSGDLLAFTGELLLKLFVNSLQEVTFTVSGLTDVPAGEKLSIKITMGDVVFKAKVLDVIKAF